MSVRTFHHSEFPLERFDRDSRPTVSVVLPARECAATIGPIVETLMGLRDAGVVQQVVVIDADSDDGTADVAAAAGADVFSENVLLPDFGPAEGKGDAMWRALSVCEHEIVCYLDADSGHFGEHFVCGTLGPLLFEPGVQYVKAFFRRPFRKGDTELPEDGGRVTELTARPLLRRFWPELASMRQPLAGEMAARRELLMQLPFSVGYAVETALLLDVYRAVGVGGLAQVDLELRQNDHKALLELAPMADEVLAAASIRLEREGRLTGTDGDSALAVTERPPMAAVQAALA